MKRILLLSVIFFSMPTCAVYVWAIKLVNPQGKQVILLGDLHVNNTTTNIFNISNEKKAALICTETIQSQLVINYVEQKSIPLFFEHMDEKGMSQAFNEKSKKDNEKFIHTEKRDKNFSIMIIRAVKGSEEALLMIAQTVIKGLNISPDMLAQQLRNGILSDSKLTEHSWEYFDKSFRLACERISTLQIKLKLTELCLNKDNSTPPLEALNAMKNSCNSIQLEKIITEQIRTLCNPQTDTITTHIPITLIYYLTEVIRINLELIDTVQEKLKTTNNLVVSGGCAHIKELMAFLKQNQGFILQNEINSYPVNDIVQKKQAVLDKKIDGKTLLEFLNGKASSSSQ